MYSNIHKSNVRTTKNIKNDLLPNNKHSTLNDNYNDSSTSDIIINRKHFVLFIMLLTKIDYERKKQKSK